MTNSTESHPAKTAAGTGTGAVAVTTGMATGTGTGTGTAGTIVAALAAIRIVPIATARWTGAGRGAEACTLRSASARPARRTRAPKMRAIMIGDEVRFVPTAAALVDVGTGRGGAGVDDLLLREVDEVLDMVCVWGDMGDALGALGDLFGWFESLGEI